MRYLVLAFFFSLSFISYSQELENMDLKIHEINGKEYYIHLVEQGNTLYAISRKYAIPVEKLKAENPRLTQELTIGDRLLIPLDEVKRRDLDDSPDIDGNFLIHEVQKKNTLYSIAKEYNVEINDIVAQNPEVENGLKKGMKIRIPVSQIKAEANKSEYIKPASVSPYVTHLVEPKETIYSLSKLYDVNIDSLLLVNNGLVGGLKIDQLINIPIVKSYIDTTAEKIDFDSAAVKEKYKVVLMLPFYLNLMELSKDSSISFKELEHITKELYVKSQYAIEFYQGFKIAVDSLVDKGLNLDLVVLDTENDTAKIREILTTNSNLNSADLIIGPLFLDNFMLVADYAKQYEIDIVSPVKLSNRILLGNDQVSKVSTSQSILLQYLGDYTYKQLRTKEVMLIYPDQVKERRNAEIVKKEYFRNAALDGDSTRISTMKEIYWDPKELGSLKSQFSTDTINHIIVPSDDQAFVTRLLTFLNLNNEELRFQVYGLPNWEDFDNIEIDYLHNLNVHLVVSEYLNEESAEVEVFQRKFMELNEQRPAKFAYLGFDVGYYYLDLLQNFGVNYQLMLPEVKKTGLTYQFNFIKTGIESGYENHSCFIIHYDNFQKKKVN